MRDDRDWRRGGPFGGGKFDRMWGDGKEWTQEQREYFKLMMERRMIVGHTIFFTLSLVFLLKGRKGNHLLRSIPLALTTYSAVRSYQMYQHFDKFGTQGGPMFGGCNI